MVKESLKIKISIANRVYPLTVKMEEEESLRNAAKKVEATIKELEASYAVRDKQDLLAMSALHFASQLEALNTKTVLEKGEVETQLQDMEQLLSKTLSE